MINIPTRNYLNAPLHIAAMFNNLESFKLIYNTGVAEVYQLNQRCIKAISLMPRNKKVSTMKSAWDIFREKENRKMKLAMIESHPLNKFDNPFNRLTSIEMSYDYCLILSGDVKEIENSIVYKQLQ